MIRLWPFSRGPEHCTVCGDAFVEATYTDGYRRDGNQIVRHWRKCPRNGDRQPSVFDDWNRRQRGACLPLYPMSCANEVQAWREHRPWWGACGHHSVSEDGSACWDKAGRQITGAAA